MSQDPKEMLAGGFRPAIDGVVKSQVAPRATLFFVIRGRSK
jgi:hypothetical protein